jgi:hypothetical protein
MEHHCGELDHQNQGEKEHEHKAYGFQLEILLGYQHLLAQDQVEITHCLAYPIRQNNRALHNN